MRFIQYELPAAQRSRSYYYLGNDENLRVASVEQRFPINYIMSPTSQEQDALNLCENIGFQNLFKNRPKTYVSYSFFFIVNFLPVNGPNILIHRNRVVRFPLLLESR